MNADIIRMLLALLIGIVYIALVSGALWVIYFFLTLPMRRNERARLFLDVLELGLDQGHTPEAAVVGASTSNDPSFGARFHLLAVEIEKGASLCRALEQFPRLLPPEVAAMLLAGERMGNLRLVLPACRKLLRDSVSQVQGALNYLILLTFVLSPAMFLLPILLRVKVLPVFVQIFVEGYAPAKLPAFTALVFNSTGWISVGMASITAILWIIAAAYIGGPRTRSFFRALAPSLTDRLLYAIPWRRKRMQRDFTHLLALLLDAGTPEIEAVRLASSAADNAVLRTRAASAADALERGVKLQDAITHLDAQGEFSWRLRNALRAGGGFTKTLHGWHDYLEAKAEQQEQAAAQFATTGMVLFNGTLVGSVVIAVFLMLISLINEGVLW